MGNDRELNKIDNNSKNHKSQEFLFLLNMKHTLYLGEYIQRIDLTSANFITEVTILQYNNILSPSIDLKHRRNMDTLTMNIH